MCEISELFVEHILVSCIVTSECVCVMHIVAVRQHVAMNVTSGLVSP